LPAFAFALAIFAMIALAFAFGIVDMVSLSVK
jgi:hypothetical protein